jgi:hypothetical protein
MQTTGLSVDLEISLNPHLRSHIAISSRINNKETAEISTGSIAVINITLGHTVR